MKTRARDASRQSETGGGGGFPSFCGDPEQTARNTHTDKRGRILNRVVLSLSPLRRAGTARPLRKCPYLPIRRRLPKSSLQRLCPVPADDPLRRGVALFGSGLVVAVGPASPDSDTSTV